MFFFLLFIFSCNSNTQDDNITVYNFMSKKIEKLSLKMKYKDSIVDYTYRSEDRFKDVDFRYYLDKDVLVDDEILYFKGKQFIYKNRSFKLYGYGKERQGVSHPRMLFFNMDYGILANVTYGVPFLSLKDSIPYKEADSLYSKIIKEIND